MQLTDIISIEKWGDLEASLAKTYHLQGSVFNPDGIRITDTHYWSNTLCPVIKSTRKGQSFICAVAHMNLANQARTAKKAVVEECDAGLIKLVVPVFYEEEYLGVVGGCGLLAEAGEVDVFAINKITGIDEKKIKDLSADIQSIPYEKAKAACTYIEEQLDRVLKEVPQ
jgi:ligand-binding sensor protein